MKPIIPILALSALALLSATASAKDRKSSASTSPCIAGDPVRSDCRSSPIYNKPLLTPDAMRQAPDTSAKRTFGTTRRPEQPRREGVPQR